ncbi:MAG: hypothetical protein FWH37_09030 [Candidatus Bathyarchaeota archaeon]|nr:hypothetical protein [Candidatus Termiticorpusculum sp.]
MSVNGKKIFITAMLIFVVLVIAVCIVVGSTMGNSQDSNTQPISPVSTENQAIEIALPLAQTYAQENNFAITATKATFIEATNSYWFVEVEFKIMEYTHSKIERVGYEVAVWADTGKIYHQGFMQIGIDTQVPDGSSEENVKITLDKAIEIALPLAQVYAQENNRTPTTLSSNCYFDARPCWDIIVNFEVMEKETGEPFSEQYGVCGYYICIWADTGEIQSYSVLNFV